MKKRAERPRLAAVAKSLTAEQAARIAERLTVEASHEGDESIGDLLLLMYALTYASDLDREGILFAVKRVWVAYSDRADEALDDVIRERMRAV